MGFCHTNHTDIRANSFEYNEVFYNRKRRHLTLGNTSVVQFLQNQVALIAAFSEKNLRTLHAAIQRLLSTPMKDAEVAAALGVSNTLDMAWRQRLVGVRVVEKRKDAIEPRRQLKSCPFE